MPQKPPQAAIEFLNANPGKWRDFEAKYGELPSGFIRPSAPDAAVKFLMDNPDKLPDFEAKYGYRPSGFEQPAPAAAAVPAPQEAEDGPGLGSDLLQLGKRSVARLGSGLASLGELTVDQLARQPALQAETDLRTGQALLKATGAPGQEATDKVLQPAVEQASQASQLVAPRAATAPFSAAREKAQQWEQEAVEALSPEAQEAIQKQLVQRDAEGALEFGEGLRDPYYWLAQGIDMATMMAPGIGAAGYAARATYAARYGSALAQASARKVPQSVALRYAEQQAQKAAIQAATIAGGLTEGAIAGGANGQQVQETLEQVDEQTMLNYPAYAQLREQGLPHEIARARVARDRAFAAAIATAAVTGITGAPLNAFIGRAATGVTRGSIAGNVAKAAVFEGGQEFVQEGSDALIANKAEQPITGKETWEGVLESAITGGILGGLLGGGLGAGGNVAKKPDTSQQQDLSAKQRAYETAAENLRSAQEAASDPSIRIDLATINEAREAERAAKVALGQAMLQSGKLNKKQQQEIAAAIEQAQAAGTEVESAPIQGEIRNDESQPVPAADQAGTPAGKTEGPASAQGAPQAEVLSEAETTRAAALERVASADTIEAAELNTLVREGLAKVNSTGRPLLTPKGRRQRAELGARVAAVEKAAETAKTEAKPEPKTKAEAKPAAKPARPKVAPTELRETDLQALERADEGKPLSAEEAAPLVDAGLARKKADGSVVLKPAGKRQLRDYKQSGRQLPVEKEFEPAVEGDTLRLPRAKRGARKAKQAQAAAEQRAAEAQVAAEKAKPAQIDEAFAAREKQREQEAQAVRDRDANKAANQKADQDIAVADATQLNPNTPVEDAIAAAKGNLAARRAKTEKAEADQMVELADLEAVQAGNATFGQIGGLSGRGLARKNADGTGTLLPAGKRRLAALKRLPPRDDAAETKRAQKARKKVTVVQNGDTYSVQVDKETVIAGVSKETADAVVQDLAPTTKQGPKKKQTIQRPAKPKGKLVTPSGEPIVAGVSEEQAKELAAGAEGVRRIERRLGDPTDAVTGQAQKDWAEGDARLSKTRSAYQNARATLERMWFYPDFDGNALENEAGHRWVLSQDNYWEAKWIPVDGAPALPPGVAPLADQYRRARQQYIESARPILVAVQGRIQDELGIQIRIADTANDIPSIDGRAPADEGTSGIFRQNPLGEPEMWIIGTGILGYDYAYRTALHEVVGHYGIRALLGADYPRVMKQVRRAFPGAVKAAAKRNGFSEIEFPDLATEELLAYSTERVLEDSAETRRGVWRRIVSFVRREIMKRPWLQKKLGVQLTTKDIEDLIFRARDFVRRRPLQSFVNEARYAGKVARAKLNPTVEVSGSSVTVCFQGGSMTAGIDKQRGTLQVRDARLPVEARGKGAGVAMAERLFQEAQARGLTLISDNRVSDNAARVYAALERRGYTVKRNPANVDRGTGELTSKAELKGVFEVQAGPMPALSRREEPMLEFRHFSNLKTQTASLDPEFMGKGFKGREGARGGPKVVSLYRGDAPNSEVENELRGLTEYRVRVPASQIYDASADPLDLRAKSQQPIGWTEDENGKRVPSRFKFSMSLYEQAIKDAGFLGYSTPQAEGIFRGQARLFKPVEARRADTERVFSRLQPEPLTGMPTKVTIPGKGTVEAGPFLPAREAAQKYRRDKGIKSPEVTTHAEINPDFSRRIAQAFEEMKHDPTNPQVKAAYAAMIQETLEQYQYVKATGLKVEFITGEDPYKASPRLAIEDVKENNHLWVFPTDVGFGSAGAGADYVKDNPLLQSTSEKIGDRILLANDVFRIVHDYFGHIAEGNGFRAAGEETAWRLHASMYSPLARAAMTTETRGQNSWLNYGPHGDKNRTAVTADTVFADQKIGLLPAEFQSPAPDVDVAAPSVTRQISKMLKDNGGFTMNPFTGVSPKEGWAFSPNKTTERVFDFMPSTMDLQQYIVENAATLRQSGMFLGGWRDATTGKVYVDISRVLPNNERPAAAKAAQAAGQLAMFNLGTQETVRFDGAKPSKAQQEAQQTIAKLSKYLTPEERQMVNRTTAQKLVDLFKELPSDRDLAAAAIAGQAKRGWYRKSAEALVNIFGPDSARFAALLAALSPQTSVEGNLTNAVRVWTGWVKAGRPTDPEKILDVMGENVQGSKASDSVLPAWRNNSIRALTAEDPENIQLSGPKVDSFAANLRGETNAVTLDTWMANFALVEQKIFGGTMTKEGVSGKRFGYLAYSARVRQAAERLTKVTGEVWTPAEVQETVWSWAKALYEEVDSFGGIATAEDLVASNEVTDALINATPDFATLFQNDEYARVLRDAGYGEALDRVAEQAAAERGTPSKKVAPLEGDQKRLLKAAQRLDALRKQRREAESEPQAEEAYSILGGNTGNPDLDSFLSKFGGPKRTLKQMWQDWTDSLTDKVALQVFDQFHGIKRAETLAGISAGDSGYISARLSGNSAELVRAMLEYGYPVWNGGAPDVAGGMGLMQILKPLGKDINLWLAYMVAKRADRLATEGRENLFTQPEITAALQLGRQHPEFDVVAQKYADFQAKVLDFAQAAGIIDPASRALWQNADYIPFYRIIDSGQVSQSTNAGSLARVANQIRQLRGGDQNLGDPLENIVRNWMALSDAALKAKATRETVDNLNGTGLVTRAPQFELTQAIIPLSQIKTWIKNNPILVQTLQAVGIDPAKLNPQAFAGLQKMMAVQAPTDEDVISVWRNGKREYWKVHDELLLTSLQGIDAKAWGPLMEVFRFPKRVLTAMVTSTPQFAVKNLWRDMWHAFVQGAGRGTITPGLDTVRGTISQVRMDTDSRSILAGGGSFTHGYIRAGDLEGGAATVRRALRGRTAAGRILGAPGALWTFYRDMLNASENSHRVQIYRHELAAGKTRKEALYAARDMLDFSMRGRSAAVQFLVESVPFLNARMQGLYRIGRGLKANFAAIATRGLLLTAATAAIFARYQDDERYRELTDDQRNLYWHFWDVFEQGDHWKLPKPFEVGTLFATVPEAILDAMLASDPEPDAAKQSLKMLGHAFAEALNLSPQIQTIWPTLELAINKNTFTGAPILNMGDEGVLPEDQDSPRISPTYRALARAMPEIAPEALRSPKQLEHLGRGYLGNLQDYVLIVSDAAVRRLSGEPPAPERTSTDWPGLRDFRTEGPSRHTKYLDTMYAIADEAEKVARSVRRNEEKGSAAGDARVEELEAENGPLLDVRKDFAKAVEEATKLRQAQRNAQLDPDSTPEEKRQEIDAIQLELNDLAKDMYDLRPGGKLNPETASKLIGARPPEQARVLRESGFPATAKLLGELQDGAG